ncbi:kinase-like protein [Rhizophagus irregularis]|nr:kinase-like protein [Rhizophagus irregularis]
MELVNTNDENSFDPMPRLKSSPVPIKFLSFKYDDIKCFNCGEEYIEAVLCYRQKYCKKCLSRYINDIPDNNNTYLDVYIYTMDLECSNHEISRTKVPQNIQECCGNCVRILCFKQMVGWINNKNTPYDKVIESESYCKLCGKSFEYPFKVNVYFRLCLNCYSISSEWIESTLVKKRILILYLPWWHDDPDCNACKSKLTFTSDCQKYCANCCIFYVGCRYCLTTNIIFGPILESKCKKCKRISLIINSREYSDIDDFLFNNVLHGDFELHDTVNIVKNIGRNFDIRDILNTLFRTRKSKSQINWTPYSQFEDVKEMTKGGYGIIHKATWLSNNETVILKRFENSKNSSKYFLNELESYRHCIDESLRGHIIKIYGFTRDPESEDYILVMKYASEGDLHKYLQKSFKNITWNNQKLRILWQISEGLEHIHKNQFIHRDFHSGNILFDLFNDQKKTKVRYQWKIGDLGLSHSVNNKSSNNEIYGVIPYIAPEIFKGSAFSKEADVYSLGMIMWELTTGCKPFANVKHDHSLIYVILDGERPEITEDTPECYANLMKSCWDHDPKKRPSIKVIRNTFGSWAFRGTNKAEFNQAEAKRKTLIELKKIGPEFAEKYHSEAIYTSRPLSDLISKCSSINSFSTISYGNKQDSNYISLNAVIKRY